MSLLGLDIGITGCKAVAFGLDGAILAQAYREYPLYQPHPGWMELDPGEVWQAVSEVIGSVAAAAANDPVTALSVATHGESVLPVEATGRPLGRFISAIDTRAGEQARWWDETLGRERIFQITGLPLHPMYTVNKLMWLRQRQPEVYNAAHRFLCMQDFVFHQLGLPPALDYSLAARTMALDVGRRAWSEELIELARLDLRRLSRLLPSGSIVGEVPTAAAERLGLRPGVLAVTGGHDQPAGALGCGAVAAGIAMDSTGTVECVGVASPRLVLDDALLRSNLPVSPHTAAGMTIVFGYSTTGGALLRWYRDTFGRAELDEARASGRDVYDVILEQASEGPSPVLILPHFVGSGTPWMDAASKGAILGLDLSTTRGQIVKAMLDSVSYEIKLSLDAMEAAGIAIEELRAFGGGARSPLWLQVKADIYGKPVRAMDVAEAPCLGVAILAGVAGGAFNSVEEGLARMVRATQTYHPDPARVERYAERHALFREVYPALAQLNHRL
jgi:xylulokinase